MHKPPVLFTLSTDDPDEAKKNLSSVYTSVRVGSEKPSCFDLEADAVMYDGVSFSRAFSSSGASFRFEATFDGYGLTLPESGGFELSESNAVARRSPLGGGLMSDSRSVTSARLFPGTAWQRVAVSTDAMHERLEALSSMRIANRIGFSPYVATQSVCGSTARSICAAVRLGAGGEGALLRSPASLGSLREAVINLMLETMPHTYSSELGRRERVLSPRYVRRAMEYIRSHALTPMRLEDVAVAASTSVRSLQASFRKFQGITPMAYLRQVRLEGARLELLEGEAASVADVAYRWGFTHPAVFSSNYVKAYAEKPSTTLQFGTSQRIRDRSH